MSDVEAGAVRYELRDRIATITLDRPDRLNAMTIPMFRDLIGALDRVDRSSLSSATFLGELRDHLASAPPAWDPYAT